MRTVRRGALAVVIVLGTVVIATSASSPGAAQAEAIHPLTVPVRQATLPVIIPAPTPDDGGSAMAPAQAGQTSAWRIADTNGVPARVRAAPSLTAVVVMRLEPGTVVEPLGETVSADGYQWRRISVAGSEGWIATSLLLEPAVPPHPPVYKVAAVGERGLNVREGPSTASAIVGSLREGEVVERVDGPREGEGRQWLLVRTDTVTGWVIEEAISQR